MSQVRGSHLTPLHAPPGANRCDGGKVGHEEGGKRMATEMLRIEILVAKWWQHLESSLRPFLCSVFVCFGNR